MKAGANQPFYGWAELQQKREELAALRARHAEARAALQQLRDEIYRFERQYDQTLGRRMAELERIEAEIARLAEPADHQGRQQEKGSIGSGFADGAQQGSKAASRENCRERPWNSEVQDIKSLYREVAKAVHPDLTGSESGSHELMSRANRAYAGADRKTLQEILRNWRLTHNFAEGGDDGDEQARLIRQIARERQELQGVNAKLEELKGSYACRFKMRVDANPAIGSQLFADMIAAVDVNIARALRRLALLKDAESEEPAQQPEERQTRKPKQESEQEPAQEARQDATQEPTQEAPRQRQGQARSLSFPSELSCGTIYLRDRNSINYSQWKELGPARGTVRVGADQAVRLDVKEQAAAKLSRLKELKPYDLQSLFLYDVCDKDLENIVHLAGLEELYLSGARLTDSALIAISLLGDLKRIYIYQTSISDQGLKYLQRLPNLTNVTSSGNKISQEGLAGLQKAAPRVKTVSFQWKR